MVSLQEFRTKSWVVCGIGSKWGGGGFTRHLFKSHPRPIPERYTKGQLSGETDSQVGEGSRFSSRGEGVGG